MATTAYGQWRTEVDRAARKLTKGEQHAAPEWGGEGSGLYEEAWADGYTPEQAAHEALVETGWYDITGGAQ